MTVARTCRRFTFFSITCALFACETENRGLDYTVFSVRANRIDASDGGTGVVLLPAVCITMPMLNGSIVEERRTITSSLSVRIRATPERAQLDFSGASARPEHDRVYSDSDLRSALSEIAIQTPEGTVLVTLATSCPSLSQ